MLARLCRTLAVLLPMLSLSALATAAQSSEERSLTELRDTVANLLQALVERGVLTREQAQKMVKDAQDKAAADAAATAQAEKQKEKEEEGAVRVPYVPQIVKDEIRKEVVQELGPSVKKEVVDQVASQGTLAAALPEWVRRMRWSGDVRVRGEGDNFDRNNATFTYLDFNQINSKGGESKAGTLAFLNTTRDEERLRLRLRFGFDVDLGSGFATGLRIATGSNGEIIATTNQTLGTYGSGYVITVDQGYLSWTDRSSTGRQIFTTTAGRFENPWLSTDLIWYNDLTFEGLTSNYRLNLSSDNAHRHDLYATVGAFPLSSFSPFDPNPTNREKWLLAGQLGADWRTDNDSRVRFGAAYYDYLHIVGQRNVGAGSTLYNWTAPAFVQKGNTLFDITDGSDRTANLFALAANYRIVDLTAVTDFHILPRYSIGLTGEALKNIGFKSSEVYARTGGQYVPARTRGYRADLAFGSSVMGPLGTWRATVGYRYLERDAVLDAFNDEDFHLGGTDAKGYTVMFDLSFNPRVWLRAKYMAANAIDGPPLAIDVWQLDMNARF